MASRDEIEPSTRRLRDALNAHNSQKYEIVFARGLQNGATRGKAHATQAQSEPTVRYRTSNTGSDRTSDGVPLMISAAF